MTVIDERIVRLSININGQLKTYEDLFIDSTGCRYANPLQGDAEVNVANLTKADVDFLLTETSPFNKNHTPKLIILEAGRKSTGTTKVFEGNITSCVPSQPPDTILKFKCQANKFLTGKIIASAQAGSVPLSKIAGQIANDLGLQLLFEATDKNISNYAFTGGALKQVDRLGSTGGVNAYVDGNQLIIKNTDVPLSGQLRVLNEKSGMVGIPEITEHGVKVSYLLDNTSKVGGALQIESEVYPTVNGTYAIYKLGWRIASRAVPFYWIAEAKRQDANGHTVIPTGIKKRRAKHGRK